MKRRSVFINVAVSVTVWATVFLLSLLKSQPSLARTEGCTTLIFKSIGQNYQLVSEITVAGKDLFNTNRSNDSIVLQPQDIQNSTVQSPSANKPAICNQPQTQGEMNNCAAALYRESDRRLNEVYKQVISKLNRRERGKLIDEQLAWIQRRDASCKDQGRMTPGGSAYAGVRNSCLAAETDKRTAELEKYLQK